MCRREGTVDLTHEARRQHQDHRGRCKAISEAPNFPLSLRRSLARAFRGFTALPLRGVQEKTFMFQEVTLLVVRLEDLYFLCLSVLNALMMAY